MELEKVRDIVRILVDTPKENFPLIIKNLQQEQGIAYDKLINEIGRVINDINPQRSMDLTKEEIRYLLTQIPALQNKTQFPDISKKLQALEAIQNEIATTTANVAYYPVPIGSSPQLKRQWPNVWSEPKKKEKKQKKEDRLIPLSILLQNK